MDGITLKMRVVLIFIISTCLLNLNLIAKELKGTKKWDRIESLIFEEIQSIKKNKPLTEKKYYRVLELLSERLSILKKRENSFLILRVLLFFLKSHNIIAISKKFIINLEDLRMKLKNLIKSSLAIILTAFLRNIKEHLLRLSYH